MLLIYKRIQRHISCTLSFSVYLVRSYELQIFSTYYVDKDAFLIALGLKMMLHMLNISLYVGKCMG